MSAPSLLRVLLVEDNPADARRLQEQLESPGAPWCALTHVPTLAEGMEVVHAGGVDAVVLDIDVADGSGNGMEAVSQMRAMAPSVPVVVLSGLADDQAALRAVKEGAQDYLTKDQVNSALLGRAVRYAVERKRADELQRRDSAQSAQLREQFVAVLGHDLRNPLSSIALSAGLLLKNGDMTPRQLKGVARIASSADRMIRMIGDLLDFTRTRLGGGYALSYRPASLRDICHQVVEELEIVHQDRSVLLVADSPCEGDWDADRMAQLASNLIGNALRYSPPETPVRATVHEDGPQVVLEVNNQGATIPAALVPLVFEPFNRVQGNPASGAAPGLGLGLYIAQQIALAHGGRIDVRSNETEGTTFQVTLPRSPPTGVPGP